ncbi:hypothetical protein Tco_0937613 [Tanacetum coccineum]|uniref:Uncharacterized protein n=1 Tax=Tanacetum coccineum TaxID=301880 RepID=A0ABQ5DFP7_9ASTR
MIQVLGENYSSTEQVNSIQQFIAYCLIAGTQGPEASESLPQKRKNPLSKKAPKETKTTPPLKPTKDSEKSHSDSTGTVPDPQDPERNIQLAGMRFPSTLDEGTHKSQPLPEGTTTDPKDSGGKRILGDKDLEGKIPPANMEPINPTVVDHSRTGAEYQVDETQSTRLRYQTLTKSKAKTSSEVESDIQTLQFTTSPSPNKDKPKPSHSPTTQESDSDSSSPNLKIFDNTHPLTDRQLIKYLRKVSRVLFSRITQGCYEENVDHREQNDKLVQATMDSLDKTTTNRVAVKDNPTLNKKVIEATEAYTKNSSTLTELLLMTAIESSQAAIRSDISSLKQDTSEIKSMKSEIYHAFKEPPSHTEGEHIAMKDDKAEEEPTRAVALIESSSRLPLTDPIFEIPTHEVQPITTIISTSQSEPSVPQREGKGIATEEQLKSTKKLAPASKVIREDPDEPIRVPYMINGKCTISPMMRLMPT